jgi:hypothetical protein
VARECCRQAQREVGSPDGDLDKVGVGWEVRLDEDPASGLLDQSSVAPGIQDAIGDAKRPRVGVCLKTGGIASTAIAGMNERVARCDRPGYMFPRSTGTSEGNRLSAICQQFVRELDETSGYQTSLDDTNWTQKPPLTR